MERMLRLKVINEKKDRILSLDDIVKMFKEGKSFKVVSQSGNYLLTAKKVIDVSKINTGEVIEIESLGFVLKFRLFKSGRVVRCLDAESFVKNLE